MLERTVKKLGKYVDIAYDASDNTWASQVLWDGTVLDGFVSKRAGYYGGVDQYMKRYTRSNVGTLEPLSFALTYLKSKDRDDLRSYRDSIYYFLRKDVYKRQPLHLTRGSSIPYCQYSDLNQNLCSIIRNILFRFM